MTVLFYIQKQPSGVCEGKDRKGIFIPVLNILVFWLLDVPVNSCRYLYLKRHRSEKVFSDFTTFHRSMSFIVVFCISINFMYTLEAKPSSYRFGSIFQ